MFLMFHQLQEQFFHRLTDFLIEGELEESSLDKIPLDDLKIANWRIFFPEGLEQLVLNFNKWQARRAVSVASIMGSGSVINGTTNKIAQAVNSKLIDIVPKSVFVKQQVFFAHYKNHLIALKSSFYFCDLVWRFLKDQSIDFNFYSKRISLLMLYIVSSFYYCGDDSEEYTKTKEFVVKGLQSFISIRLLKKTLRSKIDLQKVPILRYILS